MSSQVEEKIPRSADPIELVGTVRRFGTFGVLYEIVRRINDTSMWIKVLDTGEELAYPTAKIQLDPRD